MVERHPLAEKLAKLYRQRKSMSAGELQSAALRDAGRGRETLGSRGGREACRSRTGDGPDLCRRRLQQQPLSRPECDWLSLS
jgi:hypothetical protein